MEYGSGLRPFVHGQPIIELEFEDGTWLDLHNCADFASAAVHGSRPELDSVHGEEAITIVLGGVSNLSLQQPAAWDQQDESLLEHWHVWEAPEGAEEFEFLVGGYVIALVATRIDAKRGEPLAAPAADSN